ncbi:dihydroxy-acid dehydratase [Thioclava nitratireducens]|uniref:dihydroxy-acid dehydratase domain-containing protein n=1 Tax=Thioclava nitratireducens TaxID=1915078 RepID=UPI003CCAA5AF
MLHVTPEADLGGPLALVRDADRIRLSAMHKSIDLLVSEEELERRRAELVKPKGEWDRGYRMLYRDHVLPANRRV